VRTALAESGVNVAGVWRGWQQRVAIALVESLAVWICECVVWVKCGWLAIVCAFIAERRLIAPAAEGIGGTTAALTATPTAALAA